MRLLHVQPRAQLMQIGDFQIGTQRMRPCPTVAIQPDREQACVLGTEHVEFRIVPDVCDLRRHQIQHRAQVREGRVRAFGRRLSAGRRMVFANADVFDAEGRLVANGSGSYAIVG